VLAHNQFSDWTQEERDSILNKQLAKKPVRGDKLFMLQKDNLTSSQNTPLQEESSSQHFIVERSLDACQVG